MPVACYYINLYFSRQGRKRQFISISIDYYKSKKLNNSNRIAEVNYNIGLTFMESKDYDSAIDFFDEGIEIAKRGKFISILCLLYFSHL